MTEPSVIRLATLIVLLAAIVVGPATAQSPGSDPTPVAVTPAEREAIRGEMRTLVRSLSRVLHGIADGSPDIVEEAARTSGKALIMEPALEKKMPPAYLQLDRKVHLRFEELADASRRAGGTSTAIKTVAMLSGYCVACHEIFRLDERR